MSIGSSGDTAVKSAALVAAPIGLAVLAWCGHRFLPRQLAVLPDGVVPGMVLYYALVYILVIGGNEARPQYLQ